MKGIKFVGIILFVGLCAWVKAFIWTGRKLAEARTEKVNLEVDKARLEIPASPKASRLTSNQKYVWGWDS